MDPRLPWGSGEGIMALLHENRDVPQVPVLILTDGADLPDRRSEFDDCTVVRKPIHPDVLSSIVRTLARNDGARKVNAAADEGSTHVSASPKS
jgi:DNA-binding response OmpR family regulator